MTTDPGTFTNNTSARTTSLPYFKKKKYQNTYYIYRNSEVQKYISGEQDGIYYLTLVNASNSPTVAPFTGENFSQPVKNLYPQTNRDNPVSDPPESICAADPSLIGYVVSNNPQDSITKETLNKFNRDNVIGVGITNIISPDGDDHTIYTNIDHGLNRITKLSIVTAGTNYGADGEYYNARLIPVSGGGISGENATAKVTVASGSISAITLMDGGSAYGIGNTMHVVGVATAASWTPAVVIVDNIYDNVGDVVRISGVSSEAYSGYNELYRITNVTVGQGKTFGAGSASTVSNFSQSGVGVDLCSDAYMYQTGEAVRISSFTYNKDTGIGIVTSVNGHGFAVDQKVRFIGADQALYKGSFIVTKILDNLLGTPIYSFAVNVGVGAIQPAATGTMYAYPEGFTSNAGNVTADDENLSGRQIVTYAGITTSLSSVLSQGASSISITDVGTLDINIGDYLFVNSELLRVSETTTGTNPIKVFRGVLGTKRVAHSVNSTIRKVFINPVELRRHSIIRASGHTFEYVGF